MEHGLIHGIMRAVQDARSTAVELSHMCGEECPDCGSRETESNGYTEYRCIKCDHRWGYDSGERYGF